MPKKRKAQKGKRNWALLVERFDKQKSNIKRFECGSPGSAQVTRCRLMDRFPKHDIRTKGAFVVFYK